MKLTAPASEADMVAAFLLAEVRSGRFAGHIARALADLGEVPIITAPNLADAKENNRRAALLRYRGYAERAGLFAGFPNDVSWQMATLTAQDCLGLRVLNETSWTGWAGSRSAADAASAIERGLAPRDVVESVSALLQRIQAKEILAPIILVAEKGAVNFVILEGHARVMAAIICRQKIELPALVGTSSSIKDWYAF